MREAKRLIDLATETDIDAGLAAELDASDRIFASEDMLEGATVVLREARPGVSRPMRPHLYGGELYMSEVGRFGVFLPSYIWEGDGPERARGIKAFARKVEELGFDSLFITDHLLAAKRFYSVTGWSR